MRRAFLYLFLFVFKCSCLHAQSYKIDSLINLLPYASGNKKIDILNELAFSYSVTSVAEAEKFANEALQNAQQLNYTTGLAESLKNLGLVYYVLGEYNLAVDYSYKSLKVYEEINNRAGRSKVLNNLALIFIAGQEYAKAYDHTNHSIKLKREIGDSLGVANSLLILAEFYRNNEDYLKAHYLADIALSTFDSLKDENAKTYGLFMKGEICLSQQEYRRASMFYKDAIRTAKFSNNYIQLINSNKQLGKLFLESRKYDSAYSHLRAALELAQSKKSRNIEREVREYLANHFTAIAKFDSALFYTRSAAAIEREIFSKQKQDQILNLQTLYDFQKKEQEIEFQKGIVKRQYEAIIAVSVILVLSVIFGYRVYALNRSNLQARNALIKLNMRMNEVNENLENLVQQRTEELRVQNQKLLAYTFSIAHEVRAPLARILGLVELFKIKELSEVDRLQIMERLEFASTELDDIIREINRKLESTKP